MWVSRKASLEVRNDSYSELLVPRNVAGWKSTLVTLGGKNYNQKCCKEHCRRAMLLLFQGLGVGSLAFTVNKGLASSILAPGAKVFMLLFIE